MNDNNPEPAWMKWAGNSVPPHVTEGIERRQRQRRAAKRKAAQSERVISLLESIDNRLRLLCRIVSDQESVFEDSNE